MPVGATIGSDQMNNIITSWPSASATSCRTSSSWTCPSTAAAPAWPTCSPSGYSNTANPANPGSVSDAALALSTIAYLNTVAGCYFGTVQQGVHRRHRGVPVQVPSAAGGGVGRAGRLVTMAAPAACDPGPPAPEGTDKARGRVDPTVQFLVNQAPTAALALIGLSCSPPGNSTPPPSSAAPWRTSTPTEGPQRDTRCPGPSPTPAPTPESAPRSWSPAPSKEPGMVRRHRTRKTAT